MKELLISAIKDLFGVRPSDQTLNRYPELWHPDFLREVEIIILGEPAQEEALKLEPESPISDTLQESAPPDSQQPEAFQEEQYTLCHTPAARTQQNGQQAESPEGLLEKKSSVYATPPLYMKVNKWALEQTVLVYGGNPVYGRVEIQEEKKQIFESISSDQQVLITSQWHSSFLFHPEDEENLQVYVEPLNTEQTWLVGIPVLAKNLHRILDG